MKCILIVWIWTFSGFTDGLRPYVLEMYSSAESCQIALKQWGGKKSSCIPVEKEYERGFLYRQGMTFDELQKETQ